MFFCWIGLDLIHFCFWFLDSLSKCFFFSILNMVQSFERLDFDLGLRFWSSTTHLRLHSITASTVILVQGYVSLLCQLSAPITSLQRCIRKVRMIFLELLTCAFYIYVSLNFKLLVYLVQLKYGITFYLFIYCYCYKDRFCSYLNFGLYMNH